MKLRCLSTCKICTSSYITVLTIAVKTIQGEPQGLARDPDLGLSRKAKNLELHLANKAVEALTTQALLLS
jgi:hypothetical protein